MPLESSNRQSPDACPPKSESRQSCRRGKAPQHLSSSELFQHESEFEVDQNCLATENINDMIEQIRRCESILGDGLVVDGRNNGSNAIRRQLLSDRLLAKVDVLNSLQRRRAVSMIGLDRNNNKCSKCCNGAASSTNTVTDATVYENVQQGGDSSESSKKVDIGMYEAISSPVDMPRNQNQAYPKHQDYCMCHKRQCQRCGCICPCTEHACPSCGYTSRVVMTMRAIDGLKDIATAQRTRNRGNRVPLVPLGKSKRKRFLLNENANECSHAVMVRVGGGFVPLVEYLKSHNKVVLSKFIRGNGSAFLSPWRPYYAGPLKKGRPRGIRYVDSVTQQLEEIIFANREAGRKTCVCP